MNEPRIESEYPPIGTYVDFGTSNHREHDLRIWIILAFEHKERIQIGRVTVQA